MISQFPDFHDVMIHLQNSVAIPCLLILDIMLLEMQGGLVVQLGVMRLTGKRVICAAVQIPRDQAEDEHLHNHNLLT